MKLKPLPILLAFVVGSFSGAIGYAIYSGLNKVLKPPPWVQIEVLNSSTSDINKIVAETKTAKVVLAGLKQGERTKFPVALRSEGEYRVEVTLTDNRVCISGFGYISPGDSVTEILSDSGFTNETKNNLKQPPGKCV